MVDNERRGPVQDAASVGGKVDHASSLFRPREQASDVYGLAPEDQGDVQSGDDGFDTATEVSGEDFSEPARKRGWRDRLPGARSAADRHAPKAQGAIASAFGKQLPDRVVIGYLVTDRSKEALIAARDAVGKHLAFPNLSWVHVERFREGYFYEAHERGSGHSFLPDLVNALTLYPDRYAWIPHGDRVVKIELKGDRIKTTLMTPQQSKLIRAGDVGPLQQSRKMREAISKGDRVLAVGLAIAAVGLVAFGLSMFVRASLNSTVAMPDMVATDYLPHSQFRILNRVDTRRYVEKIEYDGSRWSIGYQDVPSMLAGSDPEPAEPATTVPGLLERARELILPGSTTPGDAPGQAVVPGMIEVAPAAPPVPGQVQTPPAPAAPTDRPDAAPQAPIAPLPEVDDSPEAAAPSGQSNPVIVIDPSPSPQPGEAPAAVDAPEEVGGPAPAAPPPVVDPTVGAPLAPAPERIDPDVAAPAVPAPAEAAPPAASEGPRAISPEERRRRIAERNRNAQRALTPGEAGQ